MYEATAANAWGVILSLTTDDSTDVCCLGHQPREGGDEGDEGGERLILGFVILSLSTDVCTDASGTRGPHRPGIRNQAEAVGGPTGRGLGGRRERIPGPRTLARDRFPSQRGRR